MLVKQSKYDEVVKQRDQLKEDLATALTTIEQQGQELETLRATSTEPADSPTDTNPEPNNDAGENSTDVASTTPNQEDPSQEMSATPQQVRQLQEDLENSNQVIQQQEAERRNLAEQLEASSQRISELEETVQRLNEEAAVSTSRAFSSSDGSADPSSLLNEFCKENEQDTMACIERLKEEGF